MKIGLVQAIYFTKPRHQELAQITLDSIRTEHEVIKIASINRCDTKEMRQWVMNNYDHMLFNDENILGKSWNKGIKKAFELGCDYVLLANTDIIFQQKCIDNLVGNCLNQYCRVDSSVIERNNIVAICANIIDGKGTKIKPPRDFNNLENIKIEEGFNACVCLFDKKIMETTGLFYEGFKGGYFEDVDLAERIQNEGFTAITCKDCKVFHFGSQTILNDPDFRKVNDENFAINQKIYYDRSRFRKIHLLK